MFVFDRSHFQEADQVQRAGLLPHRGRVCGKMTVAMILDITNH